MKNQEDQKINATLVLQIMGRPPEHLIQTLEGIIKEIDNENKISVKSKDIKKPQKSGEKNDTVDKEGNRKEQEFYSSFAEIEIEADDIMHLAFILFKYMPAHVEINYPEYLALTNGGWNDIFNELIRKLHAYDEVARVSQVEKSILERRLREILEQSKENKEGKKKPTKKKK